MFSPVLKLRPVKHFNADEFAVRVYVNQDALKALDGPRNRLVGHIYVSRLSLAIDGDLWLLFAHRQPSIES